MKEYIKELCKPYFDDIVEYRRYLHMHPELSFKEVETAKFLREKLSSFGIAVKEGISGNSVVGVLDSGVPGKNIAFRAEIDALPIIELNDVPYKSTVDGVMHACGHDGHTALVLALAKMFAEHKAELLKSGKITFLFQQAEELMPGGAIALVEDGALDGVDYAFALHGGGMPLGQISALTGARTAASGFFDIKVIGVGGHGAFPTAAVDPITTACTIVSELQQIMNKFVPSNESCVVNVCRLNAGTAYNIIPAEANIGGTVRSLNNELHAAVLKKIGEIAEGVCAMKGCKCEYKPELGYPALMNDDTAVGFGLAAIEELGFKSLPTPPIMAGDDFAHIALKVPSCHFNVGTGNPERPETQRPAHNGHFDLDETGLYYALQVFALSYLNAVK